MSTQTPLAVFLSMLAMLTTFLAAQQPATPLAASEVDRIVRTINVGEMQWAAKHKSFGSLRDVEHDGFLSQLGEMVNYTGSDSATIADYNVRIIVSSDGQHYSTAVIPTRDCGLAAFSSERGVIYHAMPLGCDQTTRGSESDK